MKSRRGKNLIVCAMAVMLLAASCSSTKDDKAAPSSSASNGKSADVVGCSGEPAKLGMILSVSGGATGDGRFKAQRDAGLAAAAAANENCEAGRPIEVVVCDEKNDPNQSAACAREMTSNGVVAVWNNGVTAQHYTPILAEAGVIEFGVGALTPPQLTGDTSKNVYGFYFPPALVAGYTSAAASLGKEKVFALVQDIPSVKFFADLLEQSAGDVGIEYVGEAFIPVDAIDVSSYVAQALASGADSFAIIAAHEPIIASFAQQGDMSDKALIVGSASLSADSIKRMGPGGDGVYAIAATTIADEKNEGTKQFLQEIDDFGEKVEDLGDVAMVAWSAVHEFAKIVKGMDGVIDRVSFRDAVQGWKVERPELPVIDFGKNYFAGTALGEMRLFADEYVLQQVQGGKMTQVSNGFIAVDEKANLTS